MKQIGTGNQLYYNDFDDNRMGRQYVDANNCQSWKQFTDAYRKSTDLFVDPVNTASKYYDGFSDPAVRQGLCSTPANRPLGSLKQFRRGYYWNNVFGAREGGAYWDNAGLNLSSVEAVASVGDIVEGRGAFTDTGAFAEGWDDDVDSGTSWLGAAAPVTGLKSSNANGKYADKAQNVAYLDSHAKKTNFSSMCSPWFNFPASPVTGGYAAGIKDPNYRTFWNFTSGELTGGISWMQGATTQFCASMPAKYR